MKTLVNLLERTAELKQWTAVLKTLRKEFIPLGADQLVIQFKRKDNISSIRVSANSYEEIPSLESSLHERITVTLQNRNSIYPFSKIKSYFK